MNYAQAVNLYDAAKERGITITYDGVKLSARGPDLHADDPLIAEMKENRDGLIYLLKEHSGNPMINMGRPYKIGVWYEYEIREMVAYLANHFFYPSIGKLETKADWLVFIRSASNELLYKAKDLLWQRFNRRPTKTGVKT